MFFYCNFTFHLSLINSDIDDPYSVANTAGNNFHKAITQSHFQAGCLSVNAADDKLMTGKELMKWVGSEYQTSYP